ncbi:oxidoreductase [Aureococcus anophagefferens]|nr:oxidoreductase [Aureococcus anophagefferens]
MACMVGQPPAAGAELSDGVASVPGPAALQGAVEVRIDGPRVVDCRAFPLVLGPARAAAASPADRTAFVSQEREALVACLRRHGAVVLRGWGPTSTSRDRGRRRRFVPGRARRHGLQRGRAADGRRRRRDARRRDRQRGAAGGHDPVPPRDGPVLAPPKYICFFCEREPATGGATPLVISRHVTAYLRATFPDLYARLKARGVRYTRVMPRESDGTSALGKGWTVAYGVERAALEARLDAEGFAYRWLAGDFVETVSPALAPFAATTGAENFFLAAETTPRAWRRRPKTIAVPSGGRTTASGSDSGGAPSGHDGGQAAADQ